MLESVQIRENQRKRMYNMTKEEFIAGTAQQLLLEIIREWGTKNELEELAKSCANAAEVIWKKAHPLQ